MEQANKQFAVIAVVIVASILLMALPRLMAKPVPVSYWKDTNIECLPNGHENLGQHIHQDLTITMGGLPLSVPANIGIGPGCMAEVHTHDTTGKIHIETVEAGKTFALADFFAAWGEPIDKEGYKLEATLDGVAVEDPAGIILKDGQKIWLSYIKS